MEVPFLGVEPLDRAPVGSLPSQYDLVCMMWGHVTDFKGFQGFRNHKIEGELVCCSISRETERGRCGEEGGCLGRGLPCLLAKLKERWEEAGLPIKDRDHHIIEILTKLKADFDKLKRKKFNNEESKQEAINKLKMKTVNLAPIDWKTRIMSDRILWAQAKADKVELLDDYIGPMATWSAHVRPESEPCQAARLRAEEVRREQAEVEEAREARKTAREEISSGEQIVISSSSQHGESSQDSQSERILDEQVRRIRGNKTVYRKRKRLQGGDDDDDDDENTVECRAPRDLLRRLGPLCDKIGVTIRQQHSLVVAFYELVGINSTEMDLSLSSAWRHRRKDEEIIANEQINKVKKDIEEKDIKIVLQFDEKELEEDISGEVKKVSRMVVMITSPFLERDQFLAAIPLEGKTGAAIAEALFLLLVEHDLDRRVVAVLADMTATNFGPYNGAIALLQDMLGYSVVIIPCLHHTEELVPKHVVRLVSTRSTINGPGETTFLKYYGEQNEVRKALEEEPVELKTFDWERYADTPVEEQARRILIWARGALEDGDFSRGDYR